MSPKPTDLRAYGSDNSVDVDCPQRAIKDVDWLAILDIWKANGQRSRYKGVWKVDNTEIADELLTSYRQRTMQQSTIKLCCK